MIHFGHKNSNFEYYFDIHKIGVSKCEKILGVWLDDKLSFTEHVYEIVNKSSRVFTLILNNIKNVDNNMLIKLYKCFVRPVLENASVVFSPHHISLIDLIENVQRRFTKRLYGMHNICYVDRLKLCNLELLELRRVHADLIMLYKILNGHICINLDNCICLSSGEHSTRGNRLKLHKFFAKLDIRKYFFAV